MNAREKFIRQRHEDNNIPVKYILHYEDEWGDTLSSGQEKEWIGEYSERILALCSVLASCQEIILHNGNISNSKRKRLKAKLVKLSQEAKVKISWEQEEDYTRFTIKRNYKYTSITVPNKK